MLGWNRDSLEVTEKRTKKKYNYPLECSDAWCHIMSQIADIEMV